MGKILLIPFFELCLEFHLFNLYSIHTAFIMVANILMWNFGFYNVDKEKMKKVKAIIAMESSYHSSIKQKDEDISKKRDWVANASKPLPLVI